MERSMSASLVKNLLLFEAKGVVVVKEVVVEGVLEEEICVFCVIFMDLSNFLGFKWFLAIWRIVFRSRLVTFLFDVQR